MSPVQREKILKMLGEGHFVITACRKAGISRAHYYDVRNADAEFAADADAAIADSEAACLDAIRTDLAWQSRAWILERRFAERWAKKPEPPPVVAGTTVNVALPADPAEQAAVLRALADKVGGGT